MIPLRIAVLVICFLAAVESQRPNCGKIGGFCVSTQNCKNADVLTSGNCGGKKICCAIKNGRNGPKDKIEKTNAKKERKQRKSPKKIKVNRRKQRKIKRRKLNQKKDKGKSKQKDNDKEKKPKRNKKQRNGRKKFRKSGDKKKQNDGEIKIKKDQKDWNNTDTRQKRKNKSNICKPGKKKCKESFGKCSLTDKCNDGSTVVTDKCGPSECGICCRKDCKEKKVCKILGGTCRRDCEKKEIGLLKACKGKGCICCVERALLKNYDELLQNLGRLIAKRKELEEKAKEFEQLKAELELLNKQIQEIKDAIANGRKKRSTPKLTLVQITETIVEISKVTIVTPTSTINTLYISVKSQRITIGNYAADNNNNVSNWDFSSFSDSYKRSIENVNNIRTEIEKEYSSVTSEISDISVGTTPKPTLSPTTTQTTSTTTPSSASPTTSSSSSTLPPTTSSSSSTLPPTTSSSSPVPPTTSSASSTPITTSTTASLNALIVEQKELEEKQKETDELKKEIETLKAELDKIESNSTGRKKRSTPKLTLIQITQTIVLISKVTIRTPTSTIISYYKSVRQQRITIVSYAENNDVSSWNFSSFRSSYSACIKNVNDTLTVIKEQYQSVSTQISVIQTGTTTKSPTTPVPTTSPPSTTTAPQPPANNTIG